MEGSGNAGLARHDVPLHRFARTSGVARRELAITGGAGVNVSDNEPMGEA